MRTKTEKYAALRDQIAGLIEGCEAPVARRATAVAVLFAKLPRVSWAGFYLLREGHLLVDVYQGPVACLELAPHTGVCWAAVDRGETVVVPDVHSFPGHIACDERARSEIVVPLRNGEGRIVGVLDLDSREADRFDDEDRSGLEGIVGVLAT